MPSFTADPAPSAHRAALLHCSGDPTSGIRHHYYRDGLLLIEGGRVRALGPAAALLGQLPPGCPLHEHTDALLVPGFVDAHVHYPQLEMIGAQHGQLLDWLHTQVYPTELRYADPAHAQAMAALFLDELLAAGTTTAAVFTTVHAGATEAFFAASEARGLRMLSGKVLMDENAPALLCDGADRGEADTRALIEQWHGRARLEYAISPRYAGSCSAAQLRLAGRLLREYPGVRLHTHLAENRAELALVARRFPQAADYLDAYASTGLLGAQSIFAHCIHLDANAWQRLAESGSSAVFCPSANLFLGSGLFPLEQADGSGTTVGLGSDVGAGTSLSLLRTMGAAWQVQQLRDAVLSPLRAFYMATLGSAQALGLDAHIGNFALGKEADFIVLDRNATPLLGRRMRECGSGEHSLQAQLSLFATLGDERTVRSTWIMGRCVHRREEIEPRVNSAVHSARRAC